MKCLISVLLCSVFLFSSCSILQPAGEWACERIENISSGGKTIGTKIGHTVDLALSITCGVIKSGTGNWSEAWEDLKTKTKTLFGHEEE